MFDLYEGAQVGAGKKSIALRLSFRSAERTLSEDEVNRLRGEMLKKVRPTREQTSEAERGSGACDPCIVMRIAV